MLLDALFIIFIAAGFLHGFRGGLIYSVFAFAALFFGMLLAMKYSYIVSDYLYSQGITQSRWVPLISFAAAMGVVFFVMKLFYRLIQTAANRLFLGTINKIIGGIFWAAIFILISSIALWYLDKLDFISAEMRRESKTYPLLIRLAPEIMEKTAKGIPYFQEMFDSIESLLRKSSSPSSESIEV